MEPPKSDINSLCEYIVASDIFGRSSKKRKIFNYIIQEELAGRGEKLKEYNIAIDALGYPESFNPQIDSSIRAEMYRLRKDILAAKDQLKQFNVKISFRKGSYRPHFLWEQSKLSHNWLAKSFAFLAIFALISTSLFLNKNNEKKHTLFTECPLGRPVILLDLQPHALLEPEVLLLEKYLKQYQLFHIPQSGYKCQAQTSPTFSMSAEVATRDNNTQLIVNVREPVSNKVAYSNVVSLPSNSNDLKITLAKIAYELAHPTQILAQQSRELHWDDSDKKKQYECIVGIFDYYIDFDLNLYYDYYECLKAHHKSYGHLVEVDAALAYLNFAQYRGYVPGSTDESEELFRDLTREAQTKNASHPEVKIMVLREQYSKKQQISKWRILSILEGILDGQEYNPHILNQVSLYYGTWVDEWELAMSLSERAAKLDSSAHETWHMTYGFKTLLDDDPKMAFKKIAQLDFHATKIPNIIALCAALQVKDIDSVNHYRTRLNENNIHTKKQIIEEINLLFPVEENRAKEKLLSILAASDLK